MAKGSYLKAMIILDSDAFHWIYLFNDLFFTDYVLCCRKDLVQLQLQDDQAQNEHSASSS
jgi:hypothetical protein